MSEIIIVIGFVVVLIAAVFVIVLNVLGQCNYDD